jgi:M6 family metalloprotease-like protein
MCTQKRSSKALLSRFPVVLILWLVLILQVTAAPLRNIPQEIIQPDGSILYCFASGDEFHSWLHDADGFTIIQDQETGFFVYADKAGGHLIPTNVIAGRDDPAAAGLQAYLNISPDIVRQRREDFNRRLTDFRLSEMDSQILSTYEPTSFSVLNNIVIFIRFNDDSEFTNKISSFDDVYNKKGAGVHSVYEYYQEASYGQLELFSYFFPAQSESFILSYKDGQSRDYYRPKSVTNTAGYEGEQDRIQRLHTLLKNAVEFVENQIPQHISIDKNNDGNADAVSFIVRGRPEGWGDLLWPHRWRLFSHEVTIHGKRVWDYTFMLEEDQASDQIPLGTIAHEMFHLLGAPDLYRYDDSGFIPVGPWDLMSTADLIPPHMNAYMKYLYGGWVSDIPEITQSGTYTLKPLHEGDYLKIPSATSPYEFFMVEYRNYSSRFEQTLPGEGLIVYRINTLAEGDGNEYAPDEVYVYRPQGSTTSNGQILQAHFSANTGRTSISDHKSPSAFHSDGNPSGVHISNISAAGETISFDVTIDYEPPAKIVHYDRGYEFRYMGTGREGAYEFAIRLTADELTGLYGQDLTSVVLILNEGSGNDITLKIWEGGSATEPGTLVHSEYIGDRIKLGGWYNHDLNMPVRLQQGLEYWVGYRFNATGGHPLVFDGGPVVENKGAWMNTGEGWVCFKEYGFDINLRVRAVVSMAGAAIISLSDNHLEMAVYPDRTKNASFRISNPGKAPLTFTASASGGESVITKVADAPRPAKPFDLNRREMQTRNLMSGSDMAKSKDWLLNREGTLAPESATITVSESAIEPVPGITDEVVLILDDGNHMADGFLGFGGGNYFYWRNDFQLDKDFNLEKIRFFMKTENESTNPVQIMVAGADGSFVFDTTYVFDLSSSGKWFEFPFPDHTRTSMKFKQGDTFSLIVGSLNPDIKFPAGYDAEGKKPGFSYYGYYAYLMGQWTFSGWANLKVFFEKGAFLIRAVGNSGTVTENKPPVAVAQVSPRPAGVNQTVTFNGANSYDPDGQIVAYLWEFGDGQTSTQMNTTHAYAEPGNYTYRLMVTDNQGATCQAGDIIQITDKPPRWTLNPSTGTVPAGGHQDIQVSYNSEGLAEGNYQAQITISSNAGNITIPVNILISREVNIDEPPALAYVYALAQNYPNPFNPGTSISWELATEEMVSLQVFDITGRLVATLANDRFSRGRHQITFNAGQLSSGIYLYRLRAGEFTAVKRMVYVK